MRSRNIKPVENAVQLDPMSRATSQTPLSPTNNRPSSPSKNSSIMMPDVNHKDALGRLLTVMSQNANKEHFLRPRDGRLQTLKTQNLQGKWVELAKSSWGRVLPVNRTPILIEILHWVYPYGFDRRNDRNIAENLVLFSLRYIAACFAILICLFFPTTIDTEAKNGGRYDAIVYKDWRYPKVSRNSLETRSTKTSDSEASSNHSSTNSRRLRVTRNQVTYTEQGDIAGGIRTYIKDDENTLVGKEVSQESHRERPFLNRILRPRYLCFLREGKNSDGLAELRYEIEQISDSDPGPEYVFVSYTRAQFWTSNADDTEESNMSREDKDVRLSRYKGDRAKLLQYGIRAAFEANVPAFWIDFKCIPRIEGQESSFTDEIYNIDDVVRAAHSMVIVTGWPLEAPKQSHNDDSRAQWLLGWGTRIWTLPEMLLCPPEYRVKVYARDEPGNARLELAKRNLALHAYEDAHQVRQLLDHFESLQLSRLELSSIALSCFQERKSNYGYTGDVVYSLMGLFRSRPKVDTNDSEFEAFARLSMVNDSDKLLERLICMLPPSDGPEWHQMKDHWKAMLWDIEPHCQVAGIVDDRTITLDGAFAASIQWDSLGPVAFLKRHTMWRTFQKLLLRILPGLIVVASVCIAISIVATVEMKKKNKNENVDSLGSSLGSSLNLMNDNTGIIFIIGLIILTASLAVTAMSPLILWSLCGGKFWATQASFYGIEGDVHLGVVEKYLFGLNCGRLHWSAYGSNMSCHDEANDAIRGECRAVERGVAVTTNDSKGNERLFTVVDTFTMTAFQFHAAKPPTAVIVCGREGGMQRAILCSYHWRTATYCRETVLRMETVVLDKMPRIPRFRFALSRPKDG